MTATGQGCRRWLAAAGSDRWADPELDAVDDHGGGVILGVRGETGGVGVSAGRSGVPGVVVGRVGR